METSEIINLTTVKRDPSFAGRLTPAGALIHRCIQCGTCSASCPAATAMDLSLRRMWRMVQLGLEEQVLRSKTIWLCSLCYQCQVRCPRGIPLTETITRMKGLALEQGAVRWRESAAFYRAFSDVIRRYGQLRDLEFMIRYFLAANPLRALGYTKVGLTLLARGKAHLELPRLGGEGRLDPLFRRVKELEAPQ